MAFYRKNIGGRQQALRVAVGVGVALMAYYYLTGPWAWVVGIGGVFFAYTGFFGYCPMCAMVGINTADPDDDADGRRG